MMSPCSALKSANVSPVFLSIATYRVTAHAGIEVILSKVVHNVDVSISVCVYREMPCTTGATTAVHVSTFASGAKYGMKSLTSNKFVSPFGVMKKGWLELCGQ